MQDEASANPSAKSICVHATITGRVQGVGYRAATLAKARSLNLKGWVRNQPDGTVEAVFAGPQAVVEAMLAWCRQGPPAAAVQAVKVTDEGTVRGDNFHIVH